MFQKTIKNKIAISGKGLHTGCFINMQLLPAPVNTGIKFKRTDINNQPYIKADINNVFETNRRTVLKENGIKIETVEHLLAAVFSSSINNLIIELNGPEIPILDGSSKLFIDKIDKVGTIDQSEKKVQIEIPNYFKVENTADNSKIEFYPHNKLEIEVNINYQSNVLRQQKAKMENLVDFKKNIASARTFCFLHELDYLLNNNLIQGGDINNGIIFVEQDTNIKKLGKLADLIPFGLNNIKKGVFLDKKMHFENEQAKHKLLDLLGDIALAGFEIKGKIIANKPGHKINAMFTKKLLQLTKKRKINMNTKPLMNRDDIKKILPHREPFLFIDEIRNLEENRVIGIKYVTKDEYYFKGHFPGAPVMPGVLQIEAMAQTGGILALNSVPDPENYLTYFMKIDKVKFKQKVEPNCTLVFKLHLLSPIRRGICHMQAQAYVNDQIVTEAELMAKIVKEKK